MGIASIARTGLNYAGRLIFDDRFASKVASRIKAHGKIYKQAGKSRFYDFHKQIGDAFQRADKMTGKINPATGKPKVGIFGNIKRSFMIYGNDVADLWKNSNKSFFSKIGGTLKGLGKRAPLIGTVLMVAFELPNIFKATKEGGLVNGALEVGKSGVRIAAGVAGGAIGTAILGPLGSIPGFIIGDLLGKLVVGKSYSEKKAAEQERIAQANANSKANVNLQNTLPEMTMSPKDLLLLQQMLYSDNNNDFLYKSANNPQLNVTA